MCATPPPGRDAQRARIAQRQFHLDGVQQICALHVPTPPPSCSAQQRLDALQKPLRILPHLGISARTNPRPARRRASEIPRPPSPVSATVRKSGNRRRKRLNTCRPSIRGIFKSHTNSRNGCAFSSDQRASCPTAPCKYPAGWGAASAFATPAPASRRRRPTPEFCAVPSMPMHHR